MKVALIEIEPIEKYPPAMAVLKNLVEMNYEVSLFVLSVGEGIRTYCEEHNVKLFELGGSYKNSTSPVQKMIDLFKIRKACWKLIDENTDADTILWVFSTITLKHLGKELLNRKYVLHLFELTEHLYYFKKLFNMHLEIYCQHAIKVVVCETNRAHITQAWMKLKEFPTVLPNKPYDDPIEKNSPITSTDKCKQVMAQLVEKKIILYQGVIDDERPLDAFITAVQELGDDYAFVVMSGNPDRYQYLNSSNYYYIGYVQAPLHMEVTSHAYIGVLVYVPSYDGYSSPLNSIYCAPNKIFEFSKYGIPMLGNNIPGLTDTLEKNGMGACVEQLDKEQIKAAIAKIAENYDEYSENALNYYGGVDNKAIIASILKE